MIARLGAVTPDRVEEMGLALASVLMHEDHVDPERVKVYAVAQDNQGLLLAWQAIAPRSPVWAQLRVHRDGVLVVALADTDGDLET